MSERGPLRRIRAGNANLGVSVSRMVPFVPMLSNYRNSKCAVPGVSTVVRRTFRSSEPSKTVSTVVRRTFRSSEPSKTGLVATRWFLADPHHRP